MIGAHRNSEGEFTVRRDEHPTPRKNPGGGVVYVARYTNKAGKRVSAGTFPKKGPCKAPATNGMCCAQHRIYWAYEQVKVTPEIVGPVGEYALREWLRLHPRSERSDKAHVGRLRAALALDLGAGPLGKMLFADVERKHAVKLVDILLRDQGRAAGGARAIVETINAMWRDAYDDGRTKSPNPFLNLKIRSSDARVAKPKRMPRTLSWEQMHALAAAAGPHEVMLRLISDCGLRVGEALPIHREDVKLGAICDEPSCPVAGPHLHVRRRAWMGSEYPGTKNERGETVAGRVAPLPPVLAEMLRRMPTPIHAPSPYLFPGPTGLLWRDSRWREKVWEAARAASGVDAAPHDFRHTWVSRVRAAMVDVADVASAAGHTVETATKVYTHPLNESYDAIRRAVGE